MPSRVFTGSTSHFFNSNNSHITGPPFSMALRLKRTSGTDQIPICILQQGTWNSYTIYIDASNQLRARARSGSSTLSDAVSAPTVTGRWYSVVCVFASSTSRRIYIDGVGSAEATTAITAIGLNRTVVGRYESNTGAGFAPFNGLIEEVGLYAGALDAMDAQALTYMSARGVRRDILSDYWMGNQPNSNTPFMHKLAGGFDLARFGSPGVSSDHSVVRYPERGFQPCVAEGGGPPPPVTAGYSNGYVIM